MKGRITSLCGDDSVQIKPEDENLSLDLKEVAARFSKKNIMRCNDYLLQVRIDECEMSVFSNGRAIIKGLSDSDEAIALYLKYIPELKKESGA